MVHGMKRRGLRKLSCEFCSVEFMGRKGARFCSHSCVASATRPRIHRREWSGIVGRYRSGETTSAIAASLGCSEETIRGILIALGVPRRRRGSVGSAIGTRRDDGRGYVLVKTQNGWKAEHRAKVEASIGRRLRVDEHVHHIDGDRSNNADENLEVMSRSEHGRSHNGIRPDVRAWIESSYLSGMTFAEMVRGSKTSIGTVYKCIAHLPRRRPRPMA